MTALQILQTLVHYSLHLLFPVFVAWLLFRPEWKQASVVLLLTMLVDLDHVFAWPDVFVADRCGMGFHPMHSWWAIAGYMFLAWFPQTRVVATGLLLHMATDLQDCMWMVALANE